MKKTCSQKNSTTKGKTLLNRIGCLFFLTGLVASAVLCLLYGNTEAKQPLVLIAACVFALIDFDKNPKLTLLQKIILVYLIELQFNITSQQFTQFGSGSSSIIISLAFIALLPFAAAFAFGLPASNMSISDDFNQLLKGFGGVFLITSLHMIFLFLLLKSFYKYGYEHNSSVIANICLYFAVFIFCWIQLKTKITRRFTAAISTLFWIIIFAKGI
ncbi:MAG: hypothetical protein H8D47_05425 [Planctomycetes bacterium]|nr:hypothetical protein [Planctomycetota bacterium]